MSASRGSSKKDQVDEEAPDSINERYLQTGPDGLTSVEVSKRLQEFGYNRLEEKVTPSWIKFLKQFIGPMPMMIWLAIVIEAVIKDWPNFGVLLTLQVLNGTVGWWEEHKAGNAVAALKKSLEPRAQVKRNGVHENINAEELVPGDLVMLSAGAAVPADSRVCAGANPIEVDQSAMTGESLPVTMHPGTVAYMGSNVVRGEAEAIVVATGSLTFFGKTAAMINTGEEMGHFQKILLRITLVLLAISIVMVSVCFGYLLYNKEDTLQAIAFAVVLLVASIPIAMQVVCTTTMALGSRKLAEHKAIVSRLSSIEELAGMNMLCSDKTGTLTLNKMELQEDTPVFMDGVTREQVLQTAALAARWKEPAKDALDRLVLGSVKVNELDEYEQIDYLPFDPAIKRTEGTLKAPDGTIFKATKGAPQILINMCCNDNATKQLIKSEVQKYAERGIRCLAIARTLGPLPEDESAIQWHFMGILTFLDPPRADTAEVIRRALELGCPVKMITGDQVAIARETCRMLDMGTTILDAESLPSYQVNGPISKTLGVDFGNLVENADGFAEVFPEHKFLIVEVLRQMGYHVGMTGDGVNDAPALKKADIGIAVEGATDAARAAADIVLTSPGLSVIVEAISMSRVIFQRMRNYVIYRVACTLQLLLFFFISVLAIHPSSFPGFSDQKYFSLPVIALIMITILNDGTIISIAYDHVKPSPYPEKWNLVEAFIVSSVLGLIAVASSIMCLYFSLDSRNEHGPWKSLGLRELKYEEVMMTLYLKISLSDFLTVFAARTRGFFCTRAPGRLLLMAFIVATGISTILSRYWPFGDMMYIEWELCGYIWVYCLIWFFIQDISKVLVYRFLDLIDINQYRKKTEVIKKHIEVAQRLRAESLIHERRAPAENGLRAPLLANAQ